MNRREIEDLIVGLLAEDVGKDSGDLRAELEDLGEWLPIDSLLAVEVLVRVEEAYGVKLPATPEAAENLRSITAFAQAILDLVEQQSAEEVDSA